MPPTADISTMCLKSSLEYPRPLPQHRSPHRYPKQRADARKPASLSPTAAMPPKKKLKHDRFLPIQNMEPDKPGNSSDEAENPRVSSRGR